MITFPNAKINLGLRITEKRPDGFHNLETVFYPVPLCDVLEVIVREDGREGIDFQCSGIVLSEGENLCVKAARLLKQSYPGAFRNKSILMHLHKVIPTGAGLGGGSSDAANVLISLNKIGGLNLSSELLQLLAVQIGSDCPFFIGNKPVFARGKGEQFSATGVSLKGMYIMIVKPEEHVSTPWAYGQIRPAIPELGLDAVLARPVGNWKDSVLNDFEVPVFAKHPRLGKIKEALYERGADFAAMSGSGSTLFGIFRNKPEPLETEAQTWVYRIDH